MPKAVEKPVSCLYGDPFTALAFDSSTHGPPGRIAPAAMLELLEGFDPPTRCLQSSRSSRLSYNSINTPAVAFGVNPKVAGAIQL